MSVDQLSGYLVNNSTQFQELGYSTEDALAMLISLSDGGANVGTVMSGLTKGVGNLSEVTDDVPGAFQDAVNAIAECGSVSEALQAQVGDTGKTVEEIFGKKAAQELATNIQNGSFSIEGWTQALQENDGALQSTTENATTMQDAMSQAANNVSLALGSTFAPAIAAVVTQVAQVITQVAQVVQDSPMLQAVVMGVAVALGILAAALAISAVIQGVTTAFGMLNTVLFANPIFLVVTAIAALVAALIYAYNNCEEFRAIVNAAFAAVRNVATNVFTSVRNTVTTVFNTISSIAHSISATLSSVWNGIKTTASSVWNSIRSTASSIWNSIRSTASSVWNGIRTAITNPIQSASSTVQGIINRIKGFFPISIGRIMSNIKLPHFSISGEFSLNPPKVPSFDIDWYAKGIIFNAPTLIPTMNGVKGVGEAGPEAVSPISVLQTYVGSAVQRYAPQIDYDRMGEKVAGACAKLGISIEVDKRQLGRVVREVVG
jgi:phage-related protein